ncbi:radical SAM protein [Desulfovibrio sp. OttesenSCG-928-C06]|nr:radical SAM protein [Desulfovibrio sp. OttesenSCG-928-C06]
MLYDVIKLEMHVTHTCNLTCKYCSHYCDYGYHGDIDFDTGARWLSDWSQRVNPSRFSILGGEPLLHKDIKKYIIHVANCFPKAARDLTTNGLLLSKHEDILPLLIETGTLLRLSIHPLQTRKQVELVERALLLAHKWETKGLRLVTPEFSSWTAYYHGEGKNIYPAQNERPDIVYNACRQHECTNLHQGHLWMCPLIAYLPMIADKLNNKSAWEHYLSYRPLSIDCSDAELKQFFEGPHDYSFCAMCAMVEKDVPGIMPENICADIKNEYLQLLRNKDGELSSLKIENTKLKECVDNMPDLLSELQLTAGSLDGLIHWAGMNNINSHSIRPGELARWLHETRDDLERMTQQLAKLSAHTS